MVVTVIHKSLIERLSLRTGRDTGMHGYVSLLFPSATFGARGWSACCWCVLRILSSCPQEPSRSKFGKLTSPDLIKCLNLNTEIQINFISVPCYHCLLWLCACVCVCLSDCLSICESMHDLRWSHQLCISRFSLNDTWDEKVNIHLKCLTQTPELACLVRSRQCKCQNHSWCMWTSNSLGSMLGPGRDTDVLAGPLGTKAKAEVEEAEDGQEEIWASTVRSWTWTWHDSRQM